MPRLDANGIEIEYETFGDPKAAPLLLVSGLGSQLTSFDVEFCELLRDRGFYVIRYDNRDAGLSTKIEAAGEPDLLEAFGGNANPAYQLDDLADDAVGLLSGLGIRAAHVVGVSMGGFIAQLVAINHPDRVLSLTSIMSGPGGEDEVPPQPEGAAVLMRVPPPTREGQIEHGLWIRKTLKGPGDPFDEAVETRQVKLAYDRSYYPVGTGRQLVAILAAKSRLEKLSRLRAPVLVIHGTDDVLVPIENGRRVANAVPGARLLEFERMGHNLPERVWPQVLDAIAELAQQAQVPQPR
ncbi:MAG TPA: alpha/beta hydrolase [Candidatus Acidoferrum sp.]|jgi:pimeloyl-ACP methyl ester carboxylesterase|nr:alpha/beta hydrolase [Candidatus Acidoferrum sp.]